MSNFANLTPTLFDSTVATAASTDVYLRVHTSGSMPSFTLCPSGWDRSTITPNLLTWAAGNSSLTMGPMTLPSLTSFCMLDFAEVHMPFPCWKPILKPSRSPRSMYSLNPVLGCSARCCVHTWRFSGETMV